MKVTILNAKGEVLETIEDNDVSIAAALAQAALLRWHAVEATSTFQLRLEGEMEKHPLHIECVSCQTSQEMHVEPWFVGAVALAFHTSHEGHPLRIEYAGRVLESPPKGRGLPIQRHRPPNNHIEERLRALAVKHLKSGLRQDREKFNVAFAEFSSRATSEWVESLIGEDDITVTQLKLRPDRKQSGYDEEGRFLLVVQVQVRVQSPQGVQRLVFPYVEVLDVKD